LDKQHNRIHTPHPEKFETLRNLHRMTGNTLLQPTRITRYSS